MDKRLQEIALALLLIALLLAMMYLSQDVQPLGMPHGSFPAYPTAQIMP